MKTNQFNDKICWITGASSGIGAALATSLSEMGAHLILSARNSENLELIKSGTRFPDRVAVLPCDMEDLNSLPSIARQAWNLFGGIDIVFLNAGIAVRDMIIHTDLDMVQKVMNINFLSNVVLSKSLLPLMLNQGHGRFVVTSSLCGKFGVPKLGAYSASKHALHGFFESLRAEYEKDGVAVTMITAGLVRTQITLNAVQGNGTRYGKMQESVGAGISAESCAAAILEAVARRKSEVLVGALEKYSVLIKRFFPGLLRMAITKHPMKKLRDLGLLPRMRVETSLALN
jgi:dehydrogenase/reductase SDR family protein 7B